MRNKQIVRIQRQQCIDKFDSGGGSGGASSGARRHGRFDRFAGQEEARPAQKDPHRRTQLFTSGRLRHVGRNRNIRRRRRTPTTTRNAERSVVSVSGAVPGVLEQRAVRKLQFEQLEHDVTAGAGDAPTATAGTDRLLLPISGSASDGSAAAAPASGRRRTSVRIVQ